ncbi:MAG: hypothetical protein HC904_07815 [Blastochloris sp.]|nr:hypothetical protein [Blastochloris sp.]
MNADEVSRIKILLPEEKLQQGIQVSSLPSLSARDDKPQKFSFTVMNLFEDEIFLEVTNFEDVGIFIRGDGISSGRGGKSTVFPDNTNLLKRLHSSKKQENGSFVPCGCCMVSISGSTTVPSKLFSDVNIDSLKKVSFTMNLTFRGYFRKTGKQFIGSVEIPVRIKEFEQDHGDNDRSVNGGNSP